VIAPAIDSVRRAPPRTTSRGAAPADYLIWRMACEIADGAVVATGVASRSDPAYLASRSAEVSIPDLFDHARRGRIDAIFFGAVEVDGDGCTNLSAIGSLARPAVTFPGVAGACTLRRWARHAVLCPDPV